MIRRANASFPLRPQRTAATHNIGCQGTERVVGGSGGGEVECVVQEVIGTANASRK